MALQAAPGSLSPRGERGIVSGGWRARLSLQGGRRFEGWFWSGEGEDEEMAVPGGA